MEQPAQHPLWEAKQKLQRETEALKPAGTAKPKFSPAKPSAAKPSPAKPSPAKPKVQKAKKTK